MGLRYCSTSAAAIDPDEGEDELITGTAELEEELELEELDEDDDEEDGEEDDDEEDELPLLA